MMNFASGSPTLFIRKQDDPTQEDIWDDSLLNKAFDRSIKKAKKQIMKKIRREMALNEGEVIDITTDDDSSAKKKKKKHPNKTPKEIWKVGSACRAKYSVDGEEYEAEIKGMVGSEHCIVRYVGYENEEKTALKDLAPSLGKQVIQLQIERAEKEKSSQEEMSTDVNDEGPSHSNHEIRTEDLYNLHDDEPDPMRMCPPQRQPMVQSDPDLIPPPPPFGTLPFNMMNPMARPQNNFMPSHPERHQHNFLPGPMSRYQHNFMPGLPIPPPPTGDEAHNAMLLSWYTCGYYTGYYQCDAKRQQNFNRPN